MICLEHKVGTNVNQVEEAQRIYVSLTSKIPASCGPKKQGQVSYHPPRIVVENDTKKVKGILDTEIYTELWTQVDKPVVRSGVMIVYNTAKPDQIYVSSDVLNLAQIKAILDAPRNYTKKP